VTAAVPKARLMSESFHIRDDEAACEDCDWTWTQPARPTAFDVTGGGKAAKRHALENGHETVIRRVQFTRHTGFAE
jgi:ketosteroid isomerase-like protein